MVTPPSLRRGATAAVASRTAAPVSGLSHGGGVEVTDFQVLSKIGQGGFGTVLLVRKHSNGQIHAMKVLLKSEMQEGDAQRVVDEGRALAEIRHPFVVRLHYAFHDERHVYFVLAYLAGGDMASYIDNVGTLPEAKCVVYVAETALALGAVHAHGFVYRDLKPDNLLLGADGHLALADFGLAKKIGMGGKKSARAGRATTFCGTPAYMAPEQFLKETYGDSVDWWALGLVYSEMIFGDLGLAEPFNNENYQSVLTRFRNGTHLIDDANIVAVVGGGGDAEDDEEEAAGKAPAFSAAALDLRRRLLTIEPADRLCCDGSLAALKGHAFFRSVDWDALVEKQVPGPLAAELSAFGTIGPNSGKGGGAAGGGGCGGGGDSLSAGGGGDSRSTAGGKSVGRASAESNVEIRKLDELFEQFTAAPDEFAAGNMASMSTWSTMLCDAASKNDGATLENLFTHGAPVDACDYDKRTPMHLVCSEGCMEALQVLVRHGADLNPVDRWGNSPLDDAHRSGHSDVGAWLKAHGGETGRCLTGSFSHLISAKDVRTLAPLLCEAASKNDVAKLRELVCDLGADANYADYDKRTALHLAASEGHAEAVKFLVDVAGAAVNARDRWAHTPVDDARRSVHRDVAALLLSRGGESGEYHSYVDARKAARAGDLIALRVLVAQKVDVDAHMATADGTTPLHAAAAHGHFDCVRFLCAECRVDPAPCDRQGRTPKDLALAAHQTAIAAFLKKVEASYAQAASSSKQQQQQQQSGKPPKTNSGGGGSAASPPPSGRLLSKPRLQFAMTSSPPQKPRSSFAQVSIRHARKLFDPTGGGSSPSSSSSSYIGATNAATDLDQMATPTRLSLSLSPGEVSRRTFPASANCPPPPCGLPKSVTHCPLSGAPLNDPVVAPDGYTYERAPIELFFESYGPLSPCTHEPLHSATVTPNLTLKQALPTLRAAAAAPAPAPPSPSRQGEVVGIRGPEKQKQPEGHQRPLPNIVVP